MKGSVSGAMSDGTICPACVCLARAWLDDRVGMFGRREEGDEQLDACRVLLKLRLMFRRVRLFLCRRWAEGYGLWLVGVAYCVGGWVGVVWGKGCEKEERGGLPW